MLPCKQTLRSYIGSSTASVGVTDLVKQNLAYHLDTISPVDRQVHLLIDEIAIKPGETYFKNVDKLIGHVDYGGVIETPKNEILANKLLTFAITGLRKRYTIIVGYFLVSKLTGHQLHSMTLHVLKEVEDMGYKVIGLSADNAKTNVVLFKMLSKNRKNMSPTVDHPFDANRSLFLSFDSSHIIKNVKNIFIDRPLKNQGKRIRCDLIIQLYKKQAKSYFKLA